jgi:hypothetical protein
MIMGADAPWCEFGQFKRSSTEGGFRQKVHRCRFRFRAKSWGYSAFQYILPDLAPETNRCASRFATTASALRASAVSRGGEIAQLP